MKAGGSACLQAPRMGSRRGDGPGSVNAARAAGSGNALRATACLK